VLKEKIENLPMPNGMKWEEIITLLLKEEYGFLPKAPVAVKACVEQEKTQPNFCAGKAKLERILLTCQTENGPFTFPVTFTCPTRMEGPIPCVIHINFRDLVPDRYEPSEEIVDAGYAVLSFCYENVTKDNGDFTDGLAGVVYPDGKRLPDQCGKIGLWSWAASRVMDYALTLPQLDHSRITVAGHSRLGKTALLTGALDHRFFCAHSNDSGCSGASLARENQGETIADICRNFPYWFCGNYTKYVKKEDTLPFDQHFLLAANAPHRVHVSSAQEDAWADPANEYLSCVAASSYYEEQGLTGFVHPDRMQEPGETFHQGRIGYDMRTGTHYFSRVDWQNLIAFLNGAK